MVYAFYDVKISIVLKKKWDEAEAVQCPLNNIGKCECFEIPVLYDMKGVI